MYRTTKYPPKIDTYSMICSQNELIESMHLFVHPTLPHDNFFHLAFVFFLRPVARMCSQNVVPQGKHLPKVRDTQFVMLVVPLARVYEEPRQYPFEHGYSIPAVQIQVQQTERY